MVLAHLQQFVPRSDGLRVSWVGTVAGGELSAIQVQHESLIGDAGSCNDVDDRSLPKTLAAGLTVSAMAGTYEEFCSTTGCAAGAAPTREIYLSSLTTGAAAALPAPTTVTVADIAGTATAPGSRAVALEGSLVRLVDVHLASLGAFPDGGAVTDFAVADPGDASARALVLDVSNFLDAPCVRDGLTRRMVGGSVASITGVLEIGFGTWALKLRQRGDVPDVTCGDAGP
jgi:hypothetical protein